MPVKFQEESFYTQTVVEYWLTFKGSFALKTNKKVIISKLRLTEDECTRSSFIKIKGATRPWRHRLNQSQPALVSPKVSNTAYAFTERN